MRKTRSWECYDQQRIVFEIGGAGKLGAYMPPISSRKVLVVTDRGLIGAGILEDVLVGLRTADLEPVVFDGVESDPPTDVIMGAVAQYADAGLGAIVAVGGGSSIDTAKCIGVALANPGHIVNYVGWDLVSSPILPLVALPTTAGTGSEVSTAAVITDTATHSKVAVSSDRILPQLALLDPRLLRSCPPMTAAGAGLDALSHALEAYTSTSATPVSDGLAVEAIRLIGGSIRAFVNDPEDLEAASEMLTGSALACMAVVRGALRLGAVHATAEAMGGFFHVHHGLACGLLMPAVVRYNLFAEPTKYARVAELLGEDVRGLSQHEAARRCIVALQKLLEDLAVPKGLGQIGVDRALIPQMAAAALERSYIAFNCRKPTVSALETIYEHAF